MSLIRRRYANINGFNAQRNRLGRRWTGHLDARQIWLEAHGCYPFQQAR
jgi:hypothetical protein